MRAGEICGSEAKYKLERVRIMNRENLMSDHSSTT